MLIQFSPDWFLGYDIALEVLFSLITLSIACFAYNIYKISNEKRVGMFSVSFFLISVSYIIQSVFNFLALLSAISLSSLGLYLTIMFRITGLLLLTLMTLQAKRGTILLVMFITLISILSSSNALILYSLYALVFLIIMILYYFRNYAKNKLANTLLILFAFVFLFFGNFHYFFVVEYDIAYVLGHLLELIAYLLILLNLILVRKNEKKKQNRHNI